MRQFCFSDIHFEITGDPCNLIGSQQCDLFTNRTFCFPFPANEKGTPKQTTRFQIARKCSAIHSRIAIFFALNRITLRFLGITKINKQLEEKYFQRVSLLKTRKYILLHCKTPIYLNLYDPGTAEGERLVGL